MPAATASASFVASKRRLIGALFASAGATPTDPSLSMRRPGRAGLRDDLPLSPASSTFPPAAVRWLTRATFGFNADALAAFNALGASDDARWTAWVERQLDAATPAGADCDGRIASAGFTTLNKTAAALWADHHSQTSNYDLRMLPIVETECMTLIRQTYSERQLYEVMVDFWHDHFSVFGWDYDGGPMFVAFDRDAVRANAFGNFHDLLQAVGESASMMYMLDLYTSFAGHPNENYSRELHELHTLGAENYKGIVDDPDDDPSLPTFVAWDGKIERLQYVDDDVYEAARVLTGWTISQSSYETRNDPNPGTFEYVNALHDPGVKRVLHRNFSAGGAQSDGITLFNMLAQHPGTAHFLAGKLCRRLVGDQASQALVQSAAALFQAQWQAPDQIAQVLRLVLASDEFKNGWGTKMKRPAGAAVGALRALAADFTPAPDNDPNAYSPTEEFVGRLQAAGHRLFYWPAPNGYPDNQVAWSSTGAFGMTLKLLPRLLEMHQVVSYDNTRPFLADVQAQTLAAFPNAADRSAANVIGYWCDRILGYRPEPTHGIAVDFFRQEAAVSDALDLVSDDIEGGVPQHVGLWHLNPANQLSKHYTIARLRVAIGLILCSPEFLRR